MPNDKPDNPPIIINIDKAVGVHIGDTYIGETQPNAEPKPSVEPKPKYIINQAPKPE